MISYFKSLFFLPFLSLYDINSELYGDYETFVNQAE